jgi:hypothetical protein
MKEDVGIGMTRQPARKRDRDAPEPQGSPAVKPMDIVADTYPHSLFNEIMNWLQAVS